ncbi:hypothetical protein D3C81_974110 [compost metagenome]
MYAVVDDYALYITTDSNFSTEPDKKVATIYLTSAMKDFKYIIESISPSIVFDKINNKVYSRSKFIEILPEYLKIYTKKSSHKYKCSLVKKGNSYALYYRHPIHREVIKGKISNRGKKIWKGLGGDLEVAHKIVDELTVLINSPHLWYSDKIKNMFEEKTIDCFHNIKVD